MTESGSVNDNIIDIFGFLKDMNPEHSTNEIINDIGDLIIETYFQIIKDLDLSYRLDRFKKKKLELIRRRSSKKGKDLIDEKFDKEKKINKYKIIKGILNDVDKLSDFHSSSDLYFKNLKIQEEINTNSFRKREIEKIKDLQDEKEVSEFDLDFKDNPYFLFFKGLISNNSIIDSTSEIKKIDEYSSLEINELKEPAKILKKINKKKTELDLELIKRLKKIKLEKMEKEHLIKYNLRNFVGLIDSEDETDGALDHDFIT